MPAPPAVAVLAPAMAAPLAPRVARTAPIGVLAWPGWLQATTALGRVPPRPHGMATSILTVDLSEQLLSCPDHRIGPGWGCGMVSRS